MPRDSACEIHPEEVLKAYTLGYFPMARTHDDPHAMWVLPEERGVLMLTDAHLPRSLRKFMARDPYLVTANQAFPDVLDACAERYAGPSDKVAEDRSETWINDQIREAYLALRDMGFSHSIECWRAGRLVGGLYGISLGGVFFGESMFSRESNASKTAFGHLIGRLKLAGFWMIDTQFYTDHLSQFGVVEIPDADYQLRLDRALRINAQFPVVSSASSDWSTTRVLQSITQTS